MKSDEVRILEWEIDNLEALVSELQCKIIELESRISGEIDGQ